MRALQILAEMDNALRANADEVELDLGITNETAWLTREIMTNKAMQEISKLADTQQGHGAAKGI
jgi:hypothetical protein